MPISARGLPLGRLSRALAMTLVVAVVACAGASAPGSSNAPSAAGSAPPSSTTAPTTVAPQTREIAPRDTDSGIDAAGLDVHYVALDPGVTQRGQLFVFLTGFGATGFGGTDARPSSAYSTRLITQTAAAMGFHAINLSYPNTPTSRASRLCAARTGRAMSARTSPRSTAGSPTRR